jgi:hypothetical protein
MNFMVLHFRMLISIFTIVPKEMFVQGISQHGVV